MHLLLGIFPTQVNMKSLHFHCSLSLLLFVQISHGAEIPRRHQQRATKEQVLNWLASLSSKGQTVTGQHNREPNSDPSKWTRKVQDITGVVPGLWGGDFLFSQDDIDHRGTMIEEAIRQWDAGQLSPSLGTSVLPQSQGKLAGGIQMEFSPNLNQWTELIGNGTNLNNLWKARLDEIVPFLRRLKEAGVIPIFRPIHEINEAWSWWGGRPGNAGSSLLYKITYDHLVTYHGIDNMIWTWCIKDVEMSEISRYWPGDEYVDVASLDIWMKHFPSQDDYNKMLEVANGKPISLGEVGALPSPQVLQQQNRWAWFMVWAEYLTDPAFNSEDSVKDVYYLPQTLHQADIDFNN